MKYDLYFIMNPKSNADNEIVPIISASFKVLLAIASPIKTKNKRKTIPISIYCVVLPLTKIFLNNIVLTINSGRISVSTSRTAGIEN